MKKTIKLTESDLHNMIGQVIKEAYGDYGTLYAQVYKIMNNALNKKTPICMKAMEGDESAVSRISERLAEHLSTNPKVITTILHTMLPQLKHRGDLQLYI